MKGKILNFIIGNPPSGEQTQNNSETTNTTSNS